MADQPGLFSENIAAEIIDTPVADEMSESFLAYSLSVITARACLLYTSPSPRDATLSRMPSSA